MSRHIYVTRRGFARLTERRSRMQDELREAQAAKGHAVGEGADNWHDNFAFEEAEQRERMLSWHLRELSHVIANVRLVEVPEGVGSVQIGHQVIIALDDGPLRTIEVGGHGESEPGHGRVAYDCPLGAALLGATPGEERSFESGGNARSVVVHAIALPRPQED